MKYWEALAAGDGKAMAACYAEDAEFQDEVFHLHGADIGTMWTGLFRPGADVKVQTHPLRETDGVITGTWEAWYAFQGRPIHNVIHSTFLVEDGLIVSQRDRFNFWKWTRMALGLKGTLLGWTPMVRKAVQKQAMKRIQ
ncbi:MAG: nuclear transport factor 2 family protein [Thermoplasmatota archaeon]